MKLVIVKSAIAATAIFAATTSATAMDSIADWKDALRNKIEATNAYPSKAIEAGIEGTVTVRLTYGRDGGINGVEFVEKSGHDILDRRAFATAMRVAKMPALPEGHEELSLVVPVRFELPNNS